ncbi:hypothetical protein MKX03_034217, partial [Papaver bracteatum]
KCLKALIVGDGLISKEWMLDLVNYNAKKMFDVKLKDMKYALTTQIAEETEIPEVIETVTQQSHFRRKMLESTYF